MFTTLPLLQEIHHLGYNATGTMRSNRIDNKCPLSSVQTLAKMERRRSEVVIADMKNCKIFVTRWKDNAVVTVASTMFGKEPEGKAKRWSKAMNKSCLVDIPLAIQTYTKKWEELTEWTKISTPTGLVFGGKSGSGVCFL